MRRLRIHFFTDEFSLKACSLEPYLTVFSPWLQSLSRLLWLIGKFLCQILRILDANLDCGDSQHEMSYGQHKFFYVGS